MSSEAVYLLRRRVKSRAGRARARFKKAMESLVEERRVDPSLTDLPELETLEASTALTKRK